MKRITCPSCGGKGWSTDSDGERGPCYRCGGETIRRGSGFNMKRTEKNGCGYIYVEDKVPCRSCGGMGYTKRDTVRSDRAEYVRGNPKPSDMITVKDSCYSCGGTGYQKGEEKPGSACFPYETLIDTPYGKVKIGDLKKGQMILSYDDGKLVPRVITRKRVRGTALIFRVDFATGKALFATGHHSFLTQDGWKRLADIRTMDKIIRSDGVGSIVQSITMQKVEHVFNIYTAGEHTFIADDCVAHNFTEYRAMRTIFHRLFLDPVSIMFQPVQV